MDYTATQLAKKLKISRSYLYYLKDNSSVKIGTDEHGRVRWTEEVCLSLERYIKTRRKKGKAVPHVPPYKTTSINNRRYLGNKYKLLPFIRRVVEKECKNIHTAADIFAGTGAVASAFAGKKLITNDIMYSNYICHVAWFGSEVYAKEKIAGLIVDYNAMTVTEDNYMSTNFANTYFSLADCRKIGYIRQDIENMYHKGAVNEREKALLITSLLYAMDKAANTCGHYDAYRKGVEYTKSLELAVPVPEENNPNNVCYNMDTNKLAPDIEADLVYIDPPYNSRQYCDAYHLLENVARWDRPEVFGVAKKMERQAQKSDYCTQKATQAFEELIQSVHARYILLSYNNMAEKGNDRSNAKIKDEDIIRILEKKGTVKVFEEAYKAFSTGKSDIQENKERLFLCKCYEMEKELIPSALNYTGGKFKLLPQILPYFPQDADKVVDLFCGGCNVGINVNCSRVVFNDSSEHLTGLLETFRQMPKEEIFKYIFDIIQKYHLSLVCQHGYEYYGCDSSKGLGAYNRSGFYRLRDDFNKKQEKDREYYLMLYVLIVYSFNNQLRFNRKGQYNLPVGKRDFNARMENKLELFIGRIKSGDYTFTHMDFKNFPLDGYTDKSFFYADPPYLITCASYNEQAGWTEEDERGLLRFLDKLHGRGIRFALSNVLESRGKSNEILKTWLAKNSTQYKVIELKYGYSNSNYHIRKRDSVTKEVLVVNYQY